MNTRFLKIYEKYMSIIGPIGNLMFFIQSYKIFSSHSAASISIPAFSLSVIGLSSWLFYGLILKNIPLIIANLVGVIGAVLVLVGTLIYS
jgi:MtN3 and saliva related transmembrane protein